MKYFVDTNIFLRTAVKDNHQMLQECKDFFQEINKESIGLKTSSLVLSEIVWTLSYFYRFGKSEVVDVLSNVLQTKNLSVIDHYNSELALRLFIQHNVKYIDALIASIPQVQSGKWTVVSYDRDFDALGIKWVEPGEVVG